MAENDELARVAEDSARGGFFIFSGAALSSLIMAVSMILLGRFLGPQLYGQYTLVIVIPTFLFLFTDLGISTGITKYAAGLNAQGQTEKVKRIVRVGFLFRVLVGLLLSVISAVFAGYFALIINRPALDGYIQLVSASILLQVIYTTVAFAFIGVDRAELNALINNVMAVARTATQVGLVVLGLGISGAIFGFLAGFGLASAVALFLLYRHFRPDPEARVQDRQDSGGILKLLITYGMPVYIAVILSGLLPLFQQMVLPFFVTDAAVGLYKAAYNFVLMLMVIPVSITWTLLPAFSKLEGSTGRNISFFFRVANKYACLIVIPTTTLIILFASQITTLIYGAEYGEAVPYTQLFCAVFLLTGIGYQWIPSLFNGLNKTRVSLYITLINFIVLAVFTVPFAVAFQVTGVIVAFIVAAAITSVYGIFATKRQFEISFDVKMILLIYGIAALSAVPAGAALLFPLNSLLILAAGATVYILSFVTLMPLTRIIQSQELQTLTKTTAKIPVLNLLTKLLSRYQTRIINWQKNRHHPQ